MVDAATGGDPHLGVQGQDDLWPVPSDGGRHDAPRLQGRFQPAIEVPTPLQIGHAQQLAGRRLLQMAVGRKQLAVHVGVL